MRQESDLIPPVTRREFLVASAGTALLLPQAAAIGIAAEAATGPFQATGVRIGEATQNSAIVWTRLTAAEGRNDAGVVFHKSDRATDAKINPGPVPPVETIEGACPGMAGRVRLRYGSQADLSDALETAWVEVGPATDFIHRFQLTGLQPDQTYHFVSQARGANAADGHELRGKFSTPPAETAPSTFRFCVMTCQGYHDRDHAEGHPIYPAMLALAPKFISLTGDLVYYDNDAPHATNAALARLHWERMFSLPRLIETLRNTSGYWLKDDHDTLADDSWPGKKAGELTFAEGQKIFRQQAPLGTESYRTFRWGRDLQIWLTDGRDARSPNKMPDGPEKTIWGAAQKAWFKKTVMESDATWKVLISPTPLVGPDRKNKNDNHSNAGFAHEGDEIRAWLKANVPENFFVVCGDRHWQYHSVHPTTGVQEFSVGPASDGHAGGTPGEDKTYHRFHRVKGGFLSVELHAEDRTSRITFQLRDVRGKVVYEVESQRTIGKVG